MFKISNRLLFKKCLECNFAINNVMSYIRSNFDITPKNCHRIKLKLSKNVIPKFKSKWNGSSRKMVVFEKKHKYLLDNDFIVELEDEKQLKRSRKHRKPFSELSNSMKRKRSNALIQMNKRSDILSAAASVLRKDGHMELATTMRNIANDKPLERMRYTGDEALTLCLDARLSKRQYEIIAAKAKKMNLKLYPSYAEVREAKTKCYPSADKISVTDDRVTVKLQSLLDLTVSRLLLSLDFFYMKRQEHQEDETKIELELYSKWGCDGSGGHANYRMKFSDSSTDDSNFFLSAIVPLELRNKDTNEILWKNVHPSSTRYCRPIQFVFQKESETLINEMTNDINAQIGELKSTNLEHFDIEHKLIMTMLDGKLCNIIAQNSATQKCYLCNALPSEMNKLEVIKNRPVEEHLYKYGMSVLHAWIRFLECVLHVSYNIPFKKW